MGGSSLAGEPSPPNVDDYHRKLLDAVGVLEEVRARHRRALAALDGAGHLSQRSERDAAEARRRVADLLAEASELVACAEALFAKARELTDEQAA